MKTFFEVNVIIHAVQHTGKLQINILIFQLLTRLYWSVYRYVTRLMKRIQRGPVRGISLKLQEEERERRDNYVPEVSGLQLD